MPRQNAWERKPGADESSGDISRLCGGGGAAPPAGGPVRSRPVKHMLNESAESRENAWQEKTPLALGYSYKSPLKYDILI